jgi:hypothetical protein
MGGGIWGEWDSMETRLDSLSGNNRTTETGQDNIRAARIREGNGGCKGPAGKRQ